MGRVPKQSFPDAVRSAFDTGMPYGHDTRARRVKHSPAMLYRLSQNPDLLDQMAAWLSQQDIKTLRPQNMGAERAVFEDDDRVVKVGTYSRAVGSNDYVPPQGVWGVTPWLANTEFGPFRMEIQPRVDLVDRHLGGTVRRRASEGDIRALRKALADQGWYWQDYHIGNVGFVPGSEYRPTVIDGPVMESATISGKRNGAVANPFVPPSGPQWLAALAAMLGAGAAGTAKAGETETAGEGATVANNPAADMYSGADPGLIAYLKKMQETEPGLSGLGQATLPRPFQELAGIAAPMNSFSRDFPEMREYEDRARAAWETPSIRVGEQVVSPADYYLARQKASLGSEEADWGSAERALTEMGLGNLISGGKLDAALRDTLDTLRRQGVGGSDELFPGQTLEQRNARARGNLPQDMRYVTSEGMDKNLLATRAYNMLTAMRDEPEYKPDFASPTSALHSVLGSVLNPGARAVAGDPGSDTRSLAYSRNIQSISNPVQARAQEALYWDKLADEQKKAGTYKDSLFGGYYPQFSWTTGVGAQRQGEVDNANLNTYIGSFLGPQYLSGTPVLGLPGSDSIRTLASNLRREVPVVPEGMDEETAAKTRRQLDTYLGRQENQYAANKPMYQRAWNDTMDNLGDAGLPTSGLKFSRYSFPTPLENTAFNAPKYYFDPMTVATLGGGLLRSAGKVGAKTYAGAIGRDFVADQPFETGIAAGIYSLNRPYSDNPMAMVTTPFEDAGVYDQNGKPADPNSPEYPAILARHRADTEKLLGGLMDTASQYYGTRKPQGGRNVGRGSSTQQ